MCSRDEEWIIVVRPNLVSYSTFSSTYASMKPTIPQTFPSTISSTHHQPVPLIPSPPPSPPHTPPDPLLPPSIALPPSHTRLIDYTGQQRKKPSSNSYTFCFYKLYCIRCWSPFLLDLNSFFCKGCFEVPKIIVISIFKI